MQGALAGVPAETQQLIVAISPGWNQHRGFLVGMERKGDSWKPAGPAVPALLGRSGLAWGRGIKGQLEVGARKTEGDGRAPAGLFALGRLYGYAAEPPEGTTLPYHQVTAADAWIDDVRHPDYNKHVRVDPQNPPAWFASQRMRLGDDAYKWKLEIRHNSDPIIAGAGSAIFFHVRRGENRATAGCTTMEEETLVSLIQWLRADARPLYVLLPRQEYLRVWKSWNLPDPATLPGQLMQ
jgi:L,D-peptidoglycan transpeptidase YkuD (ErfK/YbiS/YcfS/YnhG family)